MEKIDQLFQEKLQQHEVSPSASAWSAVESQLVKKNRLVIAWRSAAVLLIGALLIGSFYWLSQSTEKVSSLAKTTAVKEPVVQDNPTTLPKSTPTVTKVVSQPLTVRSQALSTEKKIEEKISVEQPLVEEVHLVVESTPLTTVALTAAEKPMVIEFVLEDLPEAMAVAEEKETGIKKMWETMKELKNGDRSIDLRHATQELFASNKKDNTRNQ